MLLHGEMLFYQVHRGGSIAQFKDYMAYAKIEVAGIITAAGEENKSEAKLSEIRDFAKGL